MKLDTTSGSGGKDSFEKPEPGTYLGVLVGFCFLGIQPGNGKYAPRPQAMLRWELHTKDGPYLDAEGRIHASTATYGATLRSSNDGTHSYLRDVIEAHGIEIPEGPQAETREWLGKVAVVKVDTNSSGYTNVTAVWKPKSDHTVARVLPDEHWEGAEQEGMCPGWASGMVARSTDLAHRARPRKTKEAAPVEPAPTTPPPTRSGGYSGPATRAEPVLYVDGDDEDIPF